jgi:hypothetical protein
MLNAKRQAEEYARALPTSHGWPPFILVCDMSHCIAVMTLGSSRRHGEERGEAARLELWDARPSFETRARARSSG